MATPRKSASRVSHAVARERGPSRSARRSPFSQTVRSAARKGIEVARKAAKSPLGAKVQSENSYQTAIRNFELGLRAFHKQDYAKAAEVFEKLVDIDAREVAERAQIHLRLCRQRTGRVGPGPKSADEYYALGVACLNCRDLARAVENLAKADKLKPHQDHVQYALAVSHALRGNADEAFAYLEAAFALRPENRIHARRDEDFHGIATDPRFRRLVHPTAGH